MTNRRSSAPAQRVIACAGVFICCALLASCKKDARFSGDDAPLEINGQKVELPAGVTLHDFGVKSTAGGDFDPASVTAKIGDLVRFTSRDTRTHALVITGPSPQADSVLASQTQRRSPPLVAAGQAWVISLKGLPRGEYTVSCVSHAGKATISLQ